jgi:hypothetical protein
MVKMPREEVVCGAIESYPSISDTNANLIPSSSPLCPAIHHHYRQPPSPTAVSLAPANNPAMDDDRLLAAEVCHIIHDLLGTRVLARFAEALVAVKFDDNGVRVWAVVVELSDGIGFQAVFFPVLHCERHMCLEVILLVESGALLAGV